MNMNIKAGRAGKFAGIASGALAFSSSAEKSYARIVQSAFEFGSCDGVDIFDFLDYLAKRDFVVLEKQTRETEFCDVLTKYSAEFPDGSVLHVNEEVSESDIDGDVMRFTVERFVVVDKADEDYSSKKSLPSEKVTRLSVGDWKFLCGPLAYLADIPYSKNENIGVNFAAGFARGAWDVVRVLSSERYDALNAALLFEWQKEKEFVDFFGTRRVISFVDFVAALYGSQTSKNSVSFFDGTQVLLDDDFAPREVRIRNCKF